MENQVNLLSLPQITLEKVLNFLATRPYADVYQLIQLIQSEAKSINTEIKE